MLILIKFLSFNLCYLIPVFLLVWNRQLHQTGGPSNPQVIVKHSHVFGLT